MVKVPSYGNLAIPPAAKTTAAPTPPAQQAEERPQQAPPVKRPRGRPAADRTLKDSAVQVVLYLNPRGHKALKRFALDQNTKVHSLMIEALDDWSRRHGLREPMRAEVTQKPENGSDG